MFLLLFLNIKVGGVSGDNLEITGRARILLKVYLHFEDLIEIEMQLTIKVNFFLEIQKGFVRYLNSLDHDLIEVTVPD